MKEQATLIEMTFDFDEFWLSGPWVKRGKKEAQRHFKATVKTDQDWQDIQTARDHYIAYLKSHNWMHPQHGSTWFNNWRDDVPKDWPQADVKHTHHTCDVCEVPHQWTCDRGEACDWSEDLACPELRMRLRR